MVTTLPENTITERIWNGREARREHHGVIPIEQHKITITLNWIDLEGKPREVGRFSINLKKLTSGGYIRLVGGNYRLRFQSASNRIEIAANRSSVGLPIGNWR